MYLSEAVDRLRQCLTWRGLLWAPFTVSCAGLGWLGWNSHLRLDLASLLAVGSVGLLAWIGLRRWSPLIVCAALLSPLAWHFAVTLPSGQDFAGTLPPGTVVRIDATIRDRWDLKHADPRAVRLLLSDIVMRADKQSRTMAEMEVEIPVRSAWTFRSGRAIRLAGGIQTSQRAGHRLRITLNPADHAFDDRPAWRSGEAWRIRLQDRANYYLSKRTAAVFLPMVLDIRDHGSVESREVVAEFRRVGVSHIFAISGMNVALIFGMLMVAQRIVLGRIQPGQGWVHAQDAARLFSVALIWLYIAMIGLPAPAVRAAIMGTALVWLDSRGARTPPLYVLLVTGLAMLAWSPGQLYDVSFQLSFLAYAFLVLALQAGGSGETREGMSRIRAWTRRGIWLSAMNLGVTAIVTLGLWPLIAGRFGTFSWLVFVGNLLLVPVMGAVILPSAMVALAVTALYLGAPPEIWLERAAFGWVETVLRPWLWLLRQIDNIGGGWVFRVSATWSAREIIFYYLTLVALLTIVIRLRARRAGQAQFGGVPAGQLHQACQWIALISKRELPKSAIRR